MSLVTRLYNARHHVNMKQLRPEFDNLTVDPYVKNGFRRKHIVRYLKRGDNYTLLPNTPLFQSQKYNPTHGNINRTYPEFVPSQPVLISQILNLFTDVAKVPDDSIILMQAQRISCSPYSPGYPSVENWHRDGVTKVGVICVHRHNIAGGINEFRTAAEDPEDAISLYLPPGYMVVFNDDGVQHRVTPITSADKTSNGYRDVILLSYPDCEPLVGTK